MNLSGTTGETTPAQTSFSSMVLCITVYQALKSKRPLLRLGLVFSSSDGARIAREERRSSRRCLCLVRCSALIARTGAVVEFLAADGGVVSFAIDQRHLRPINRFASWPS
jgi:hypothetical protein